MKTNDDVVALIIQLSMRPTKSQNTHYFAKSQISEGNNF
jgi:hypothetical protein